MALLPPIPLFGSLKQKQSTTSSGNADIYGFVQFAKNLFFEVHKNELTNSGDVWGIARPGFQRGPDNIASSNNAQGIYFWSQTKRIYAVVNGTVYESNNSFPAATWTSIGTVNSATSGCWFDEFYDGTNYMLLIKQEAGKLYYYTSGGTVTEISDGDYTGLSAVGQIAVMDGYVVAVSANGKLANSDLNAPTAWTAANYLMANSLLDSARAVVRTTKLIAVMGEFSTEFFFNQGNASGSILSPIGGEAGMRRIGIASHKTIARDGDDIYFIGKTVESTYGLYRMRGSEIQPISNPDAERYLALGSDSQKAAILPLEGHKFYVINLNDQIDYPSLVYDITTNTWLLWSIETGLNPTTRGFFSTTQGNQVALQTPRTSTDPPYLYLMATSSVFDVVATATRLAYYKIGAPVYVDGSSTGVQYGFQTDDMTFGTNNRKFCHSLSLIGRKAATSLTVTISNSDDGGASVSSSRSVDASSDACRAFRLGAFRKRRFGFSWSGAFWAVSSMELDIEKAAA